MKISIIIPTLNEELGIVRVIDSIPKMKDLEIIVIDGDSKDKTKEMAQSKGVRVIIEKQKGYGRAYKTGFQNAKGDIIVALDADDTYPADRIPYLVNMLEEENLDFITTNRFASMEDGAMSVRNKLGNAVLTKMMNVLFSTKLKDSQSGMWVFKKNILEKLNLTSDGMSFSQEIKIEAFSNSFKAREIPIHYKVRVGEVSLCAWKDGFSNLKFLIKKKKNL